MDSRLYFSSYLVTTHDDAMAAPPGNRAMDADHSLETDRFRRVTRLLRIVSLLKSGRPHGLSALAGACGCSTKTVQRDLSYWRELGVMVDYDPEQRSYVLTGDLPFRLLDMETAEASALALAEAAMGAVRGLSLDESISSAFNKIHGLVPADVAARLRGSLDALRADGMAKRDYSHAPLMALMEAARRRLRVVVDYESHASGRRERPIEPYKIAFMDGFWIVVARDPERDEVRNFALDRIRGCRYPQPDVAFAIPEEWSLAEHTANSVGVLRGDSTPIALRFAPEAAPWVAGRRWRFPHTLETDDPNGAVVLRGTVAGIEEILREVLRWGRYVTVLEPDELRRRVVEEAEHILSNHAAGQ